MSPSEKAAALRALHVKGTPLVLYNIWDAGSAKAVAAAGAPAIATGSWSVAEAQGFGDGQQIPMRLMLDIASRIVDAVDLPVSVDFEGAYAVDAEGIAANGAALAKTGAVGCNFEDQVIGGAGLHPLDEQVVRIAALRAGVGADFVINARTDLFLKDTDGTQHDGLIVDALLRAEAFAAAGADCIFVPGLTDVDLITRICAAVDVPINVMHAGEADHIPAVAAAGVARVSQGPFPYRWAMAELTQKASARYS